MKHDEDILMHRVGTDADGLLRTYRDLQKYLATLTEAQLDQDAMFLPPHNTDDPVLLKPMISAGTVEELCHVDGEVCQETRSAKDFLHHPDQVVITFDHCPFNKYGDTAMTMSDVGDDHMIGNNTGRKYHNPLKKKK